MRTASLRVGNRFAASASARPQSAAPSTFAEVIATRNGWPIEQFRGAYAELTKMSQERQWSQDTFNGALAELAAVPPRPTPGTNADVPAAPSLFDKVRAARARTAPHARAVPAPVARVPLPLAEDVTAQPRRAVVADTRPIPPAPPVESVLTARRAMAGAA